MFHGLPPLWSQVVFNKLQDLSFTGLEKKVRLRFIIASDYLSPNLTWMEEKLSQSKKQKNIFVFVHIPQAKWTAHAIDTPAFFELLSLYKNIKAVFHGHEHDQDGIKMHQGIPFIFDAHIGGSWGTDYKGLG